jgi:hypothetical protein
LFLIQSALPPVPPKPRKVTSERDFSVSRSDSQDNLSFSFVRSKAVLELVNTERAFLEDMNLMINVTQSICSENVVGSQSSSLTFSISEFRNFWFHSEVMDCCPQEKSSNFF